MYKRDSVLLRTHNGASYCATSMEMSIRPNWLVSKFEYVSDGMTLQTLRRRLWGLALLSQIPEENSRTVCGTF